MLHAVILAGGSGTRFWPLSRRDLPKQLLRLAGARTLLQQSFDRLRGAVEPERVHVVTSQVLAHRVREQLPELPDANVIVEPEPRDTAIAIGLAAGIIERGDPQAVLAVTPSDHVIRPAVKFREALQEADELAASKGAVVTFGIPPRAPKTAYGYIRRGAPLGRRGRLQAYQARAFEEKPDLARAEAYLAGGEHLWNSGIFVSSARTLLDQLEQHLPRSRRAIEAIVAARGGPDAEQVLAAEYAAVERISIDYAVMEKCPSIVVLEADFEWSDVGSWTALPELYSQDAAGNTVVETPFCAVDSRRCLVFGDGRLVTLIGLEDVMVIQTRDATLVCPKSRAEEIKQLVARLRESGQDDYT